jgi:DNA repair ATPase RecN
MIHTLDIANYQSHEKTHLELGNLTVIVGQSSSGKSAVTRALKALAYNQTGKDFITTGKQTAQISATTDKGTVVLTKGKPEDSYVILEAGSSEPKKYTKNGTTAPEDVSAFLGIPSKDAINFAGQFDMPYLLKNSASEVARVLGELTNVSSVFNAAREALRIKNQKAGVLKTREADLKSVDQRTAAFENLPAQVEAIADAEAALATARAVEAKLSRLTDLLSTLQIATSRKNAATAATSAPLPEVETAKHLFDLRRLTGITEQLRTAAQAKAAYTARVEAQAASIAQLDEEYETALREAGTCPTCGQNTEGIHAHA